MSIFDLFERIKNRDTNKNAIEKIIVGLGNPSQKYDDTRHNVGFAAIDEVAKKNGVKIDRNAKKKFNAIVGDGNIGKVRCLLLKPLTYMNNSGEAVEAARSFYKLDTTDILVLYDDINFEPGVIKIRKKGSSGGHNGIKSIMYETGEDDFIRIKIGVGQKPSRDYDLAKWVLSKFRQYEKEKLDGAFEKVEKATKLIVANKIEEAMNNFN